MCRNLWLIPERGSKKFMKFKLEKKYILAGLTAFLVVAGGIFLCYMVFHGTTIRGSLQYFARVIRPILFGFIIAYILTPMMNYIEQQILVPLLNKIKKGAAERHKGRIRFLSMLLTSLIVVFVIYGLISMLISQIVPSIQNIISNFDTYVSNLTRWVNRLFEDNHEIASFVQDLIRTYSGEFENWLSNVLIPQTSEIIKSLSLSVIGILKVLWNFIIGFVISIYLMANKETLAGQAKKIIYALFKTPVANIVVREVRYVNQTFIGFIVGKTIDSVIIGLLCFIGTTIIGTPYAVLVSVIIGVTNVIPFFGPYLGAIPCAIFILIVDFSNPMNCVYFVIFILLLQQFDGNILGPKILGDSTGLSGFWVIFSITFFGGLFGVIGMIIGVPIFAVIFNLIKRLVNYKLKKRELPTETELYLKVGSIEADAEFKEYIAPENTNRVFNKKTEPQEKQDFKKKKLESLFLKHYNRKNKHTVDLKSKLEDNPGKEVEHNTENSDHNNKLNNKK